MPLVRELAGTSWDCDGGRTLTLDSQGGHRGIAKSGGAGRWGSMNDPTLGDACPLYACIFLDGGGGPVQQRNARVGSGTPGLLEPRDHLDVMQPPVGASKDPALFSCKRRS